MKKLALLVIAGILLFGCCAPFPDIKIGKEGISIGAPSGGSGNEGGVGEGTDGGTNDESGTGTGTGGTSDGGSGTGGTGTGTGGSAWCAQGQQIQLGEGMVGYIQGVETYKGTQTCHITASTQYGNIDYYLTLDKSYMCMVLTDAQGEKQEQCGSTTVSDGTTGGTDSGTGSTGDGTTTGGSSGGSACVAGSSFDYQGVTWTTVGTTTYKGMQTCHFTTTDAKTGMTIDYYAALDGSYGCMISVLGSQRMEQCCDSTGKCTTE